MADPARTATRLSRHAAIRRGELQVQQAVVKAMTVLAGYSVAALEAAGWDDAVLDERWPEWQDAVTGIIEPTIARVYEKAYDASLTAAASVPAREHALDHLDTVHNRLVGVSDAVFNLIRTELTLGRADGDSIPELASRVDKTLRNEGQATWRTRGTTIARTEVIAANNAGSKQAATDVTDTLGHDPGDVVKEWLATHDGRTRDTHVTADGQQVLGLATPFSVGSALLDYPGDPTGPSQEVINCRCTVLYHQPGDPAYPADVVPTAAEAQGTYEAQRITTAAKQVEPGITTTMRDLVGSNGGTMEGLDFRLKTQDSLAAKINDKIAGGLSPSEAAASISDAVRYTAIYPPGKYAASSNRMIADLRAAGYEVNVKNYWGHATNPYRGVNLALVKDGQPVELQLHTRASFDKKQGRMHRLYEDYRYESDPAVKDRLNREMWEEMSTLREPRGARSIGRTTTASGILEAKGGMSHADVSRPRRERAPPLPGRRSPAPRSLEPRHRPVGAGGPDVHAVLDQQPARDSRPARAASPGRDARRLQGGDMTTAPVRPPVTAAETFPKDCDGREPDDPGYKGPCRTDASVVIVALPWAEGSVHGIGEEEKHATLIWMGEETTAQEVADVREALAQADLGGVFYEQVTSVESLGDDGARVWMLDGSERLRDLHATLRELPAVSALYERAEQHPSFTPHVTIGYPAAGETLLGQDTEADARTVDSVRFDRLAVWEGDDHSTEYALGEQTADVTTAAEAPPVPARADDIAPDGPPWYGVLAPEGIVSGDNRMFREDSLTWRDLPLPLMYQDATAFGHEGAVRVGRIDTIERDGAKVRATGVWDTSPVAEEAQRQVGQRMLRGVSVEADDYVAEFVDENGDPVDFMDFLFAEEEPGAIIEAATHARICGATLVSVPAFHQSYVNNGTRDVAAAEPGDEERDRPVQSPPERPEASPPPEDERPAPDEDPTAKPDLPPPPEDEEEAASIRLVASAVAALTPARYFANPGLDGPCALTIDDDRRIYGHLAQWGTCHIGVDGACIVPPHSNSGYLYFATGVIDTEAGLVPVGQITMETGHADRSLRWRPAAAHYDNTGCAIADITVGEDDHGIWYSGMLRDSATPQQVRDLRASGCLSGDWRDTGGPDLELVAALAVNVPGFPIPRLSIAASGGRQTSLVASGIIGPTTMARRSSLDPLTADAVARSVLATIDRRAKVERLQRRIGRDRASRVAAAAALVRGE